MVYEFCADFFAYIQAVGTAWIGVVGFSVPYVVNEMLSRLDWYREWASKYATPAIRRAFLFLLLLGSVFLAGFLAWREEHAAKSTAEQKYSEILSRGLSNLANASRLDVSISERDGSNGTFKVRFSKNGQIAAQLFRVFVMLYYSDTLSTATEAAKFMGEMEGYAKAIDLDRGSEIEIIPRFWYQYSIPAKSTDGHAVVDEETYQKFLQGEKFINLKVVAIYKDDALIADNKYRMVRYCAWYSKNFSESHNCPGENRTVVIHR